MILRSSPTRKSYVSPCLEVEAVVCESGFASTVSVEGNTVPDIEEEDYGSF